MNSKANNKAVRRKGALLLIALACMLIFTAAIHIVKHGANPSMQRILASTFAFHDFSDTYEISLGLLREGQVLAYEWDIEQGAVELWIENDAGKRLSGSDDLEGLQIECPEDGEYFMVVAGSDAAFSVSVSIFDVY